MILIDTIHHDHGDLKLSLDGGCFLESPRLYFVHPIFGLDIQVSILYDNVLIQSNTLSYGTNLILSLLVSYPYTIHYF